ncbi:MAG: hypothetical protein KJO21_01695 [Verrucomicrobiae bacterium]|nr:hypothetical protein [Verrucomicrobiae bacterium]NNJ42249.1 hypothetical protein [Akkermansiaceae bacterium]
MKEIYTILAIVIFAYALRSCKTTILRKLGALVMLIASGLCFYLLTDSIWWGLAAAATWFFLPWVELLTRIRKMRMPLENKLEQRFSTNVTDFPDAQKHIRLLEQASFEHIRNCSWNLGGMEQLYQLYWNAETRSVVSLCLCEQSNITFSYLTITSRDICDGIWRTTNFPFSPTLKPTPSVHWNQINCVHDNPLKLIEHHHQFLSRQGFIADDLSIPDPDILESEIEHELRRQIDHNLQKGIIQLTDDGNFRYTARGLLYLWRQFIRDMIRLC